MSARLRLCRSVHHQVWTKTFFQVHLPWIRCEGLSGAGVHTYVIREGRACVAPGGKQADVNGYDGTGQRF